ncbi:MAG: VWA domain-containing protein [Candidatus Sericytochromatia bacterium]
MQPTDPHSDERQRRWRLLLGEPAGQLCKLGQDDLVIDRALAAVYDPEGQDGSKRRGGLGGSSPQVARWLGDIRQFFPSPVVRILQQDAVTRLQLERLLLEPEMLQAVEPDVHLVATLLSLNQVMPDATKAIARQVVREVVAALERKLALPLRQAVQGSLSRATRTSRPKAREIDWDRTIRANLQHYQAELGTIIPEKLVGYGHRRSALREVVLCIDQSGSMGTSVVYSAIFGAVLASLRALSTQLVVFDTAVVDLTPQLQDPVDVLFGVQLGGGTDIHKALSYCQGRITRPQDTILVLISDLYEGGDQDAMLRRTASLVASGVQMIALLALNDDGAPSYDARVAADFAALGIPSFACTPDLFPELMAQALQRQDLGLWAARHDLTLRK